MVKQGNIQLNNTIYPPSPCYSTDDLKNVQAANERGGVSV